MLPRALSICGPLRFHRTVVGWKSRVPGLEIALPFVYVL